MSDTILYPDANIFYRLELWQPDPDNATRTLYLRHIAAFHNSCACSAFRLAGGSKDRAALVLTSAFENSASTKGSRGKDEVGLHTTWLLLRGSLTRTPFSECSRRVSPACSISVPRRLVRFPRWAGPCGFLGSDAFTECTERTFWIPNDCGRSSAAKEGRL